MLHKQSFSSGFGPVEYVTWDDEAQAFYVKFHGKSIVKTQVDHERNVNVDLDGDDRVVGIEVLK